VIALIDGYRPDVLAGKRPWLPNRLAKQPT